MKLKKTEQLMNRIMDVMYNGEDAIFELLNEAYGAGYENGRASIFTDKPEED